MKKKISVALSATLVLCLLCCSAFAAGKMTVQQENFHVLSGYSVSGYAFAKVENTGDKPVKFSSGLLEIYDANGDALGSDEYLRCMPSTLAPGETGFVSAYDYIENATTADELADYSLTVTAKNGDSNVVRYPATGKFELDSNALSEYWTENFIVVEVTNNTDETVFGINMVVAILDAEGNVLYVTQNELYGVGLNPGCTITWRSTFEDGWKETWEREGLTPASVEVIAYTEEGL